MDRETFDKMYKNHILYLTGESDGENLFEGNFSGLDFTGMDLNGLSLFICHPVSICRTVPFSTANRRPPSTCASFSGSQQVMST